MTIILFILFYFSSISSSYANQDAAILRVVDTMNRNMQNVMYAYAAKKRTQVEPSSVKCYRISDRKTYIDSPWNERLSSCYFTTALGEVCSVELANENNQNMLFCGTPKQQRVGAWNARYIVYNGRAFHSLPFDERERRGPTVVPRFYTCGTGLKRNICH